VKESVKHRLIGAAVLIAAGVLFLPSLIKDHQQYRVDTKTQLPARPNIRVVDFNDPVRPEGIEPAKPIDEMFAVKENSSSVGAQSQLAGWVIQVASLSSLDSAKQLRDKLQAEGHRAYVRSPGDKASSGHRVLIGPKQNKDEISQIKERVDKQLNVNSIIIPFEP
jgi:DedD protein